MEVKTEVERRSYNMPMTSDPTTEQIVQALRYCADVNSICGDACPAHIDEAGCRTVLMQNAADRLESQEQTISALTARAEQAEKERDKAMADLFGFCSRCKHDGCKLENEPCKSCMKDYPMKQLQNWTWRGLPQEGERKSNG